MKSVNAAAVILLGASFAFAQDAPSIKDDKEAPTIQDNSFLVEEAYNQEPGVVQHISTFSLDRRSRDWIYTFTQEWPLGGQRHQLSFTLPLQYVHDGPAANRGLGDVALNYRLQLLGDGEARVAFSPRVSLLSPTGSERNDLGAGGLGLQVNLPLSLALSPRLVTHWNAGVTYAASARNAAGDQAGTTGYNLAQGLIWLASRRVNLMLETAWSRSEMVVGPGLTASEADLFISPGVRWSHNFASGLQVVPGVAFPIGLGPSRGETAVFLYVSFEHPFRKQAAQ